MDLHTIETEELLHIALHIALLGLPHTSGGFAQKKRTVLKPVLISINKPELSLISLEHTIQLYTRPI